MHRRCPPGKRLSARLTRAIYLLLFPPFGKGGSRGIFFDDSSRMLPHFELDFLLLFAKILHNTNPKQVQRQFYCAVFHSSTIQLNLHLSGSKRPLLRLYPMFFCTSLTNSATFFVVGLERKAGGIDFSSKIRLNREIGAAGVLPHVR